MLQVLSTNFGLAPESVQLKAHLGNDIVVLNGRFTVDCTTEEFQAIGTLRIVVEDLPFNKSKETAVFVMNTKDGAHDITLTPAWIEKGNTICIKPVIQYETLGSYEICLLTGFMPENIAGEIHYATHAIGSINPVCGGLTNGVLQAIYKDDWMQLLLTADALSFEEDDDTIEVHLDGVSVPACGFLPLIFTKAITETLGSKFYPASFENGILTIRKDGSEDVAGDGFKYFTKVFLIL